MEKFIDIVFDGPPGPVPGRFVEVENEKGEGMSFGKWVQRDDGYWVLRISCIADLERQLAQVTKDFEWWDTVIKRVVEAAYDGNVDHGEWDVDGLVRDVASAYENKERIESLERQLVEAKKLSEFWMLQATDAAEGFGRLRKALQEARRHFTYTAGNHVAAKIIDKALAGDGQETT